MSKRSAPDEVPTGAVPPPIKKQRRRLGKNVTMADVGPDAWRLICAAGGEVVARGLAQCNTELRTICDPVVAEIACPLRCVTGHCRAMFWYGRYGSGGDARLKALEDSKPTANGRAKEIGRACYQAGRVLRKLDDESALTVSDRRRFYSAFCLITALYTWHAPATLKYDGGLMEKMVVAASYWYDAGSETTHDARRYFDAILFACGSLTAINHCHTLFDKHVRYAESVPLYFAYEKCLTAAQKDEIGSLVHDATNVLVVHWLAKDVAGLEALLRVKTLAIESRELLHRFARHNVSEFFTSTEVFGHYWPLFKQMLAWRGRPFGITRLRGDPVSRPWRQMQEVGVFDLFESVELDIDTYTPSTDPHFLDLVRTGKVVFRHLRDVALSCLLPPLHPLFNTIRERQRHLGVHWPITRGEAYAHLHSVSLSMPEHLTEAKAVQLLDTLELPW
jgi:hypothetical protein